MPTRRLIPNAENCSLSELETAAACAPRKQDCMRMQAIRALLLGNRHADVADIFSVSDRGLTRWIKAFNERGIDGLIDRPKPGRSHKIPMDKVAGYRDLIEHPDKAEQTHWTAKKFHGYIRDDLHSEIGYSTVTRWLHEQNFCLKVPRPWPDRQDEELRKAFVINLQGWLADPSIELWFSDESGFEGDPRPRRRWVTKGSRPTRVKNGDHLRMNVLGMVCPRRGEVFAVEMTHCDTDCFQVFLDEAQKAITQERPTQYLVMDNASWHKTKRLNWGCFTPIYLPPYSPDLNPIERLWLLIKLEWFSDFVAKDMTHLIERLDAALNWAFNRQTENQKTCSIKTTL